MLVILMAEPLRDPKQLQAALEEFQGLQRQLQMVMLQRQQMEAQMEEMKGAQEELKGAGGTIYRMAGTLFIESSKEDAKKDISERLETYEVRSKTVAKQEERLRERLTQLRMDLEKATAQGAQGQA